MQILEMEEELENLKSENVDLRTENADLRTELEILNGQLQIEESKLKDDTENVSVLDSKKMLGDEMPDGISA